MKSSNYQKSISSYKEPRDGVRRKEKDNIKKKDKINKSITKFKQDSKKEDPRVILIQISHTSCYVGTEE